MRTIGLIALGALVTGCTAADLNGFASAGRGNGPELARPAAPFAAGGCVVTSGLGVPVVDRRGNPVLCEP